MGKGVQSVLFLVPKKNGDMHTILVLKWLNQSRKSSRWKLGEPSCSPGLRRFSDLSRPLRGIPSCTQQSLPQEVPVLLVQIQTLPVQGAPVWSIGSSESLHKTPGGLNSQPQTAGVRIFLYLDDILIAAFSFSSASEDRHKTMSSLSQHRFVINLAKSSLIPGERLAIWDS